MINNIHVSGSYCHLIVAILAIMIPFMSSLRIIKSVIAHRKHALSPTFRITPSVLRVQLSSRSTSCASSTSSASSASGMKPSPSPLEAKIGYLFNSTYILADVLTHPSWHRNQASRFGTFERYDFLGCHVVNLCLTWALYFKHPYDSEKELNMKINTLLGREICGKIAGEVKIRKHLLHNTDKRTSNTVELRALKALCGAVYRDARSGSDCDHRGDNLVSCRAVVDRLWGPAMDAVTRGAYLPKLTLEQLLREQGYNHEHRLQELRCSLVSLEGSPPRQIFTSKMEIKSFGTFPGGFFTGKGTSRALANSAAADSALKYLVNHCNSQEVESAWGVGNIQDEMLIAEREYQQQQKLSTCTRQMMMMNDDGLNFNTNMLDSLNSASADGTNEKQLTEKEERAVCGSERYFVASKKILSVLGISMLDDANNGQLFSLALQNHAPEFQRLEFLGDRVLGLCLAELLCNQFPHGSKKDLVIRLSSLASREACFKGAEKIDLPKHLLLVNPNLQPDAMKTVAADAMEALLGAIFIDQGFQSCLNVVQHIWDADTLEESSQVASDRRLHPKSQLNVLIQKSVKAAAAAAGAAAVSTNRKENFETELPATISSTRTSTSSAPNTVMSKSNDTSSSSSSTSSAAVAAATAKSLQLLEYKLVSLTGQPPDPQHFVCSVAVPAAYAFCTTSHTASATVPDGAAGGGGGDACDTVFMGEGATRLEAETAAAEKALQILLADGNSSGSTTVTTTASKS